MRQFRAFLVSEREVIFAFVASRLLVWALAWLAERWLLRGENWVKTGPQLWQLLERWDAAWYRGIVEQGYSYVPGAESNVAFFPLLPICVWLVKHAIGMKTALAGFIVSNLALFAAAVVLRRLVARDYPEPSRAPARAVWLLLLCPMTFSHSAMYTESLYLLLSLVAIMAARDGRWLAAGIAGALITATRGNALLIAVPLLWEAVIAHRRGSDCDAAATRMARSRWWLLMVPLGLVGYATYLHFRFGDALAFAHAMAAWGRTMAWPWEGIAGAAGPPYPYGRLLIGSAVVGLLLVVLGFLVRLRTSYLLYATAMLVLYLSTSILHSLPRYLSVIFPFYIAVAVASIRSEAVFIFALVASAGFMAFCLALFVSGYLMM
jgi:Gpi18-like mannosyltransferase